MARLDRAPCLRDVAHLGSVLGREFAYDMINALAGIEEDMLQSGLGQLVVDELSTSAAARRARAICSSMR